MLVYKADRLTRSLADIARMIETFDARGVSFVSITQQFNTTTSMGRLTLNMLLSFAQFEREVTGERIRDKIAASRARGLWMGGHVPLRYDAQARSLVVNPDEAAIVRLIFERYVELGSVASLKAALAARGIVSKTRISGTGKRFGGKPFSRGALYRLLTNRVYLGQAVHKGRAHPGAHAAIIDQALFEAAQTVLNGNRVTRTNAGHADEPSLLGGLLRDAKGRRLTPSHAVKNGKRYRYYISQGLLRNHTHLTGRKTRIPAHAIEAVVVAEIRALLHDPGVLFDLLTHKTPDLADLHGLLASASDLAQRWPTLAPARIREFVRAFTNRVIVRPTTSTSCSHQTVFAPPCGLVQPLAIRQTSPAPARRGEIDGGRPPQALRRRDQADRPGWRGRHHTRAPRTRPWSRRSHGPIRGSPGQFGAVVADDHCGSAAPGDQRVEFAHDPPAANRGVDDQGERLAREVVHDRQYPEPPAPGQCVGDEVERPALVGSRRIPTPPWRQMKAHWRGRSPPARRLWLL